MTDHTFTQSEARALEQFARKVASHYYPITEPFTGGVPPLWLLARDARTLLAAIDGDDEDTERVEQS